MNKKEYEYAGFWIRFFASLIDGLLFGTIVLYLLYLFNANELVMENNNMQSDSLIGIQFLINYIVPFIITIIFWNYKSATIGKIVLRIKIIDLKTGEDIGFKQSLIRYLCYPISYVPLGLGIIAIAFNEKKQGWHDKLANTIVVKQK